MRHTAWRLLAEPMEPRILHSADLAPLLWSGEAAVQGMATTAPSNISRSEIVFVDASLPDAQGLIADLQAQRDAGRPMEIITIAAGTDGLAQISDTLAERHGIDAVHILAHGSDGRLQLGSSVLDSQSLMQQAGSLAGWGDALTGDADLLLYGCDLAQSAVGQQLVQDLAALTGADVAASADLTGAAAAGGNWLLEYRSGQIEAVLAPSALAQSQWQGVLATYIVTSTADVLGVELLPGTLRWAISQANANAGSDTITFAVDGRIDMAAGSGGDNNILGDFDITGNLNIVGNGSTRTIINGNGGDRVFDLRGGTVTLSGMTIQGGANNTGAGIRVTSNANLTISDSVVQGNYGAGSTKGGGIYNEGGLSLLRVLVQNNGNNTSGNVTGAGIYNAGQATLDARDSEIRGNVAGAGADGGGVYIEKDASATLQNVTLADNQARSGGGVWTKGALSLVNVTLSGNSASAQGGGLWTENNDVSLDHVSIVGNSAASGGGIHRQDNSGNVDVSNSLFANNTGGNSSLALDSDGYNLSDDNSAGFSASSDRKNVASSQMALGSLASNGGFARTLAIGAASIARDTADPASSLSADQRGVAYDGRPDIGAYEFSSAGQAPTISTIADLSLAEDTASGLIAFTVADNQTAAASLVVTATSSNAALLPSASLVLGGSNGARTLSFTPEADASGTATITVTVSDGQFSSSSSFRLTVQAVNDAPLLSRPGAQTVNEDAVLSFSGSAAPSIGDVDASGAPLQLSLSVARGSLSLGSTAGLSFVTGNGSNNSSMSFTGSQSAINAALASMQYRPEANFNGADLLALTVNDLGNSGTGGARSASASIAITVNAVNDAPTLSLPGAQSTPMLTPLTFSSSGGNAIRVADIDGAGPPLQLSLTTANAVGGGTLSFGSLAGLTLVSGTGTLDSTVVLRGSAADLNAALDTLSFSAGTGSSSRLDIDIDDVGGSGLGGARQASGMVAIAIGADALPVLNLGTTAAAYIEDDLPLLLAPGLTLSDADNPTLAAAQLRISSGYAGAQDQLSFVNDAATMGNIVGSYSAGTLSLGSAGQTASVAQWQAALRSVAYANSSSAPSTAARGFTLSVNDGVADSAARQWTLGVIAVNDAPALDGANDFASMAEDASSGNNGMRVSALLAGHISDADDSALSGIAITAIDNSHGSWQYTRDSGASWQTIGSVSDASALLLAADVANAVRFVPASDWNGTVANGLRLRAWDQSSGSDGTLADARSNGGSSAFSSAAWGSSITVNPANDAPRLNQPMADQTVMQHAVFGFTVPATSFTDIDAADTLSYSATLASGAALPNWLRFDTASQTFSGTPGETDAGVSTLRVTVTDGSGASASDDFQLTVIDLNDEPVLTGSVADQFASEDQLFAFSLPAGLFTDINVGDALGYTVTLNTGAALPTWLRFDAAAQTLSGTPANADVGTLALRVTATDSQGANARADFTLSVSNANDAPVLTGTLADQHATQDSGFGFTLPAGLFSDVDAGDSLVFSASLGSGAALPAWLRFDAASQRFSGTPANADVGTLVLKVTATDGSGASASAGFTVTVANVNDAPVQAGTLVDQRATQGSSFSVTLPAGLFTDIDVGDSLRYDAQLSTGAALPAWLRFDPATQTFNGVASNDDVGVLSLRVNARDTDGASASANFTLTVLNVNDAPVAVGALGNQTTQAGSSMQFAVPPASFVDADAGDVLTYAATLADGTRLPGWLSFDPVRQRFTAAPEAGDVGQYLLRVTATDAAGARAQALFAFSVVAAPAVPGEPVTPVTPVEPLTPVQPVQPVDPIASIPPATPLATLELAAQAVPAPVDAAAAATEAPAKAAESPSAPAVLGAASTAVPGLDTRLTLDATVTSPEVRRQDLASEAPSTGARIASRADAVLAAALVPQYADLTAAPLTQLLHSDDLLRKLDELQRQMGEPLAEHRKVMASSIALTGGLSIGYVVWLVRGGVLLSSMLSALPAWQMIDPLPVLAAAGAARRRRSDKASLDAEPEVERLFDERSTHQRTPAEAPPIPTTAPTDATTAPDANPDPPQ